MRVRSALFGLILATATTSCAFLLDFDSLEGSGGSGGASASIALRDMPAALAGALCDRLSRCAGPAISLQLGEDDCKFLFSSVLNDSLFVGMPDLPATSFVYHPELAPKCVDTLRNAACTTFFDLPIECKAAIDGLIGEGGDCTHPAECQRGLYCNITGPCPGKCTAKPGEGQACAQGQTCLEGLSCETISGAPTCVTLVAQKDAACGGADLPHCELDMFCVGATQTASGTCQYVNDLFTVKSAGSTCSWKLGPLCAQGLNCQLNSLAEASGEFNGTCRPDVAAGAPCKLALPDECPAGQYCDAPLTTSIDGTCKNLPASGQSCALNAVTTVDCAKSTRCDQPGSASGKCQPIVTLNNPCVANSGCYSGFCQTNVCAPPNFCK